MIAIIIAVVALAMMARKPRPRKRMGRYLRGTVDERLSMASLAGLTAVGAIFDSVVNERTLVSSLVAIWSIGGYTKATNTGPILCGVAHSDYTDTEIEEWIEQTGSWNEGDLVAQEVGSRKIRRVGIFEVADVESDEVVLNDGKAIKTKLNWILLQGQSLKHWAYNAGSVAVGTTTPIMKTQGHVNLFPK